MKLLFDNMYPILMGYLDDISYQILSTGQGYCNVKLAHYYWLLLLIYVHTTEAN
jgi:hypothetical protein